MVNFPIPAPYDVSWAGATSEQLEAWLRAPPLMPLNLSAVAKADQAAAIAKMATASAAAAGQTVKFASLKKALFGAMVKAPVGLGVPFLSFLVFAWMGYKTYLHNQLEEEEIDEVL